MVDLLLVVYEINDKYKYILAILDNMKRKNIVLIAPVHNRTDEEEKFIEARSEKFDNSYNYYDPKYGNLQSDKVGNVICNQMVGAILIADGPIEIYINPDSVGSAVDVGTVVVQNLPLKIINLEMLPSYEECNDYVKFLIDYSNNEKPRTEFHKKVLEIMEKMLNSDIIEFNWPENYQKDKEFLIAWGMAEGLYNTPKIVKNRSLVNPTEGKSYLNNAIIEHTKSLEIILKRINLKNPKIYLVESSF